MKAKELLKEIVKAHHDVVAIAQDKDKKVYVYSEYMPYIDNETPFIPEWLVYKGTYKILNFSDIIEWDSENWKENIVTINDL